jgi:hypothetical protein
MASYDRDTDDDEVQRLKELIVMGRRMRKAQCTSLYARDSNEEKRSQKLRLILGVLPCLILRIWRLWARTKHEYMMDDFSTLTFREPWLLKKISTSPASTWLVGRNLMLQGRRDSRQGTNSTEISKRSLWRKGRLIKGFHNFLYEWWLYAETSEESCSHLYLTLWIWGVDILLFLRCNNFQNWRDAHACAVWCSWCTLEYDELVTARAIIGREGSEWWVAFSQPRYLARS